MKATARKLLALIMAMVMVLSLAAPAFAAEEAVEDTSAEVVETVETEEKEEKSEKKSSKKAELKAQVAGEVDPFTYENITPEEVIFDADGSGNYTVTWKNNNTDDVIIDSSTVTKNGGTKEVHYDYDATTVKKIEEPSQFACKAGKYNFEVTIRGKKFTGNNNFEIPATAEHSYSGDRELLVPAVCAEEDATADLSAATGLGAAQSAYTTEYNKVSPRTYAAGMPGMYKVTQKCTVCGDEKAEDAVSYVFEKQPTSHEKTDVLYWVATGAENKTTGTYVDLDGFKTALVAQSGDTSLGKDDVIPLSDPAPSVNDKAKLENGKPVRKLDSEGATYVEGFKCSKCNQWYVITRTIKGDGKVMAEPVSVPYVTVSGTTYKIDSTKNVVFANQSAVINASGAIEFTTSVKDDANNWVDGEKKSGESMEALINLYKWGEPTVTQCGKTGTYIKREIDSNGTKIKDTEATVAVAHKDVQVMIENAKFVTTPSDLTVGTDFHANSKYWDAEKGEAKPALAEAIKASSCGQDGSYEVVVYCTNSTSHRTDAKWKNSKLEVSRTPVTVKASETHTPSNVPQYNKITATLTEDGTASVDTVCAVCGQVLESKSVNITKEMVQAAKAGNAEYAFLKFALGNMEEVPDTRVEPTAYKPGSVKMAQAYTLGDDKVGGGYLDPVNKVIDPLGAEKTTYTYTVKFDWSDHEAGKNVLNEKNAKAIVDSKLAKIVCTDVDYAKLTTAEKEQFFAGDWATAKVTVGADASKDEIAKELDKKFINVEKAADVTGKVAVELTGSSSDFVCAKGTRTYTATATEVKSKLVSATNPKGENVDVTIAPVTVTFAYAEKATDAGEYDDKTLAAHTQGAGKIENENAETGYYEIATYCTVCGVELSRTPAFKDPVPTTTTTDISTAVVTFKDLTYTGKVAQPSVTVTLDGVPLAKSVDYEVEEMQAVNAGTYPLVVKGKGDFSGRVVGNVTINQAKQPMTVKATAPSAKKLKKKAQKVALTIKKAQGKVSVKVSGPATVKGTTVTAKKGTKKGKKIKITVTAAGNANYKKGSKTVTVKVKA